MYTEEQYWNVLEAITNVHNAIRCETEDEALLLGEILTKADIRWPGGTPLSSEHTNWIRYRGGTAYSIDPSNGSLEYCYTEYYINEGFNVIDFSSLVEPSISLLDYLLA